MYLRDCVGVWRIDMALRLTGFASGVAFGFILGWARLTDYDVIRDMLLLQKPDVFLLMFSAMLTSAAGVRLLRTFKVRSVLDATPITWATQMPERRHLVGSTLFGIGWSLAGTCPGPLAAQLGRGQIAAVFTIAGVLTGIFIHDWIRVRRQSVVTLGEAALVAGL
jgi:uncharacterized membrane protein YedE/YeeE